MYKKKSMGEEVTRPFGGSFKGENHLIKRRAYFGGKCVEAEEVMSYQNPRKGVVEQ